MVAREINLEEKWVYVPTPMVQEPFLSLSVAAAPTVHDIVVAAPIVSSPMAIISKHEEPCRCFVQAPASKFIVMHVRLGWCAQGHKIYTGSG